MTSAPQPKRTLVVAVEDWPIFAAQDQHQDRAKPNSDAAADAADNVDQPTAIWSHRGIVATNIAARVAGVRVGLRRREAQGRCPELRLIAADPARDARCFEPVVAALGAFTPTVEIIEPGVAALATRGPSRYFGGDTALADLIGQAVSDTTAGLLGQVRVRVGVADGPFIARLAAHLAAPGAPMVVPVGDSPRFVAPIPLTALVPHFASTGDAAEIIATWGQLGLTSLGDVAALPAAAVLGRFGTDGIALHRLARGDDPATSQPTPIPPEVDEIVDFDPPETRADAVAFVVRSAADTFVMRLAKLGLSCAQVTVTLSTDHAETHERRWRLDGPGLLGDRRRPSQVLIAERVRWQVDGWLSGPADARPSAGIVRVTLAPGEVRPARGIQVGFWGGASAADERAAHGIARLEALAGPDAVCVIEPRGGRHPADEFVAVTTAATDPTDPRRLQAHLAPANKPWPGRLPSPFPARVLASPQPIEVVDDQGRSVEVTGRGELKEPPAAIRSVAVSPSSRPSTQPVVAWAGPWPVEERWWDPERHQRQARLQLVTATGTALGVNRQNRRWWLTAIYD